MPILRALAFRTNLFVVLPGFVAVHVFGDLLANREFKHGNPDWLDIGFAITDIDLIVGGVLLTLLQFWVLRRTRAGRARRVAGVARDRAAVVVLAALVAAIVLMAGKPRLSSRSRHDPHRSRQATRFLRLTEPLRNPCFSLVTRGIRFR